MRNVLIVPVVLSLFAIMTCSATWAQGRAYPPELEGAKVETYKRVGDVELKIWIFQPADHDAEDSRPAIVFFFGGGWRNGSPGQFEHQCRYLASQGMVAMTADYRVLSRHGTPAVKCVSDAKSAVRWARQNARRLGIDPNRIVAGGGSAGGHLAACTGVIRGFDEPGESLDISSVPNAMALFNPALVLAPVDGYPIDPEKLGQLRERMGVDPKALSPLHHIRSGLPPTIIFHGEADKTVPYATVELYAKRATEAGNQCVLVGYQNAGHGFFNYGRDGTPGKYYTKTMRRLHEFLRELGYLSGPPAIGQVASETKPDSSN